MRRCWAWAATHKRRMQDERRRRINAECKTKEKVKPRFRKGSRLWFAFVDYGNRGGRVQSEIAKFIEISYEIIAFWGGMCYTDSIYFYTRFLRT